MALPAWLPGAGGRETLRALALEWALRVSHPQQSQLRNRLLQVLSPADFALLQPHLQRVDTPLRMVLIVPGTGIEHLYFMEAGFTSIVAGGPAGKVEVGLVGREGLVGASTVLLDGDSSPYEHFIQMAGEALRIETAALCAAADESRSLRNRLLRYVLTELIQARQTAFVNASLGIEARLAHWLLICHDRVDGDELHVTHEFLAMMLSAQRSGVTLALHSLEGAGHIRARRGRIEVLSRQRLQDVAGGSYGAAEAEYDRLMGTA